MRLLPLFLVCIAVFAAEARGRYGRRGSRRGGRRGYGVPATKGGRGRNNIVFNQRNGQTGGFGRSKVLAPSNNFRGTQNNRRNGQRKNRRQGLNTQRNPNSFGVGNKNNRKTAKGQKKKSNRQNNKDNRNKGVQNPNRSYDRNKIRSQKTSKDRRINGYPNQNPSFSGNHGSNHGFSNGVRGGNRGVKQQSGYSQVQKNKESFKSKGTVKIKQTVENNYHFQSPQFNPDYSNGPQGYRPTQPQQHNQRHQFRPQKTSGTFRQNTFSNPNTGFGRNKEPEDTDINLDVFTECGVDANGKAKYDKNAWVSGVAGYDALTWKRKFQPPHYTLSSKFSVPVASTNTFVTVRSKCFVKPTQGAGAYVKDKFNRRRLNHSEQCYCGSEKVNCDVIRT